MYKSVATIDSPEFINLQPLEINPLMSSCEIKVLYLGENRNRTYLTKDVAKEMAKTLRGAPIVGYYKEDKEDFGDHGQRMIIDDEGVKFDCLTKPYGFVAPNAEVWFQKFEENDAFGNSVTREYLMTTGYLWTSQYEECQSVISEGRPHSMEIDEETLKGEWAINEKTGMEFFIINDAIFSKLCILGEDVEPCFEGSSITAEKGTTNFTKIDNNFTKTLYTMMQDLNIALKGGLEMEKNRTIEDSNIIETPVEAIEPEVAEAAEEKVEEAESAVDAPIEENREENAEKEENIVAEEEILVEKDNEEKSISAEIEETIEAQNESELPVEETIIESVSIEEYNLLKNNYNELENKYNKLVEFKLQVEEKEKDALIEGFYMLSDEDKKDVIENKNNYSLEDIESKLSVICVRKKVNFDLDEKEVEDKPVMTYTVAAEEASIPAWVKACKTTRDSRK